MSYLFGSIYTLDATDLKLVGIVTLIVVIVVIFLHKEFFLLSFEEDAAAVTGLPVKMLNMLITVMTALVISTAIKIVGALLVSALLTIPVAVSLLMARSFKSAIILSVVIGDSGCDRTGYSGDLEFGTGSNHCAVAHWYADPNDGCQKGFRA